MPVYLGVQIEQMFPVSELSFTMSPRRQPQKPFIVPAGGVYQLSQTELRHLFDHVPTSDISAPGHYFDNVMNGSFGLLPEGTYEIHMTAYKWDPNRTPNIEPTVVSNPNDGVASFKICYKAQSPEFLTPISADILDPDGIAEVDPNFIQFTWTTPATNCGNTARQFDYKLRIVHLMDNQQIDAAMDFNPVVYERTVTTTSCIIPTTISSQLVDGWEYVAQVTAVVKGNPAYNIGFIQVENNGKSNYRRFKLKSSKSGSKPSDITGKGDDGDNGGDDNGDNGGDDDNDDDDGEGGDEGNGDDGNKPGNSDIKYDFQMGDGLFNDSINTDSLYSFRNPVITKPAFVEYEGARKIFSNNDIAVTWRKVWHLGGDGLRSDTLQFKYEVQLYNGGTEADKEAAFNTTPIYTFETKDLADTIKWDKIKEKVKFGDYLVIRVKPIVTKGQSVAFVNDSVNVVDFLLVEHVVKKYFQCSDMTVIDDTQPDKNLTPEGLKGKTIHLGEYELTIDECTTSSGGEGFQGKGRVKIEPMEGHVAMICVKFDSLLVNKSSIVISGMAETYPADDFKAADAVNQIFSDWGIDNFMSTSGIPYADKLTNSGKGAIASALANKAEIGEYYAVIQKGQGLYDWFINGTVDNVHLPLALPDVIANKSPVNIQVSTMRFAPTWATMDLIGQFDLPKSDYTTNDVLMFGAPRLCMSPGRILPESGTLALLADFVIVDPNSGFDMTWNAPDNLLEPTNGCYVSWHDDEFELLGVDIDMSIPGLLQDSCGIATEKLANLKIVTTIGSTWDEFMVDNVSMTPFQHEDLPGYTFTASDVIFDHSKTKKADKMGKFPEGYVNPFNGETDWMGLYIGKVKCEFPKALEFGDDKENNRLALEISNFFVDGNTGDVTFDAGAANVISAKTGKAGGWKFTLDNVGMRVVQNNFDQCYFNGKFAVPILKGDVGYRCNILPMSVANKPSGDYAYIFSTQQIDSLSLDLFLATTKFSKEQTYFLVEAVPNANHELETRVELLMSGEIAIGGSKAENLKQDLQAKLDKLPLKIDVPDVHFAKMRIANCEPWESQFAVSGELQKAEYKGPETVLYNITDSYQQKNSHNIKICEGLYFDHGSWSLASMEKKLGPFNFTLEKPKLDTGTDDKGNTTIDLTLAGGIGIMDDMISGKTSVTISTAIGGITEFATGAMKGDFDFDKLSFDYAGTKFNSVDVDIPIAGAVELEGHLDVIYPTAQAPDRGFNGTLNFKLPGDIVHGKAKGAFVHHQGEGNDNYKWGYLYAAVGGEALTAGVVKIEDVHGGFFFNCTALSPDKLKNPDNAEKPTPQKGMIGVLLGLELSTTGSSAITGSMDLSMVYQQAYTDSNGQKYDGRFTTIRLDGGVKALEGIIDAKATMVYRCDKDDRYFNLNITADAKADLTNDTFKKFMDSAGLPTALTECAAGLEAFSSDTDDDTTHKNTEPVAAANTNTNDNSASKSEFTASAQAHLSLDLKVELPMSPEICGVPDAKTRNQSDCKWHLWLGEPGTNDKDRAEKRLYITFLDFQLGKKTDPVAVWGKLYANAYFCMGNELPNDGKLPPIPTVVQQFLDGAKGTSLDGSSKGTNVGALSADLTAALEKMKTKGGVMFGAEVGGNFGCNAVIAYAEVNAVLGFDLILKKVEGKACNGRKTMGKNGWYSTGQVYAMLNGDIGLMLNLWIYKGKISLCKVGVGMLMQGGFPNPTWFYGKARAKCDLFDGLITFNKSITIKAGNVCTPEKANPLEDIEMFGSTYPEYDNKSDGWNAENKISPYVQPRFSTNMKIDTDIRLLSEDAESSMEARTYKFTVSKVEVKEFASSNASGGLPFYYDSRSKDNDHINFTVNTPRLNPNKYYNVILRGEALEYHNGDWGKPWFEKNGKLFGEQKNWDDKREFYFCTTELPPTLSDDDILAAYPGQGVNGNVRGDDACHSTTLYPDEARKPLLVLSGPRSADLFPAGTSTHIKIERVKKNNNQTEYTAVSDHILDNDIEGHYGNYYFWRPDNKMSANMTDGSGRVSGVGDKGLFYDGPNDEPVPGATYRMTIYSRNIAKYEEMMKNAKVKEGKEVNAGSVGTKTENTGYEATDQEQTAEENELSDGTYNMTNIFEQINSSEIEEARKDTEKKTSKEFEQKATASFDKTVYQCTFVVNDYGYANFNEHMKALYRSGVQKVIDFLNSNPSTLSTLCDVKYNNVVRPDLIGSESEKLYDKTTPPYGYGSSSMTRNPYNQLALLKRYVFISGHKLPSYKYRNSQTNTLQGFTYDDWDSRFNSSYYPNVPKEFSTAVRDYNMKYPCGHETIGDVTYKSWRVNNYGNMNDVLKLMLEADAKAVNKLRTEIATQFNNFNSCKKGIDWNNSNGEKDLAVGMETYGLGGMHLKLEQFPLLWYIWKDGNGVNDKCECIRGADGQYLGRLIGTKDLVAVKKEEKGVTKYQAYNGNWYAEGDRNFPGFNNIKYKYEILHDGYFWINREVIPNLLFNKSYQYEVDEAKKCVKSVTFKVGRAGLIDTQSKNINVGFGSGDRYELVIPY